MMHAKTVWNLVCLVAALTVSMSCAPLAPSSTSASDAAFESQSGPLPQTRSEQPLQSGHQDTALPVRFQQPSYVTKDVDMGKSLPAGQEKIVIPVGADIITTTGPVPLREIMKRMGSLKGMNVSWANDVDQSTMMDVQIQADEDFFEALDNLLRQADYFHEIQGNTIIVKYKATQTFHIAMPFMASTFETAVGGDVLGSSGGTGNVRGTVRLTSDKNVFDVWDTIRKNLDLLLDRVETQQVSAPVAGGQALPAGQAGANAATPTAPVAAAAPPPRPSAASAGAQNAGKGFYTIDRPVGLIAVTAPRSILEKIATYLENLKRELYQQIAIEAKILEVTLDASSSKGIDWSKIFSGENFPLAGSIEFGADAQVYPSSGSRFVSKISLNNINFSLFIKALEEQGQTRVLANPRISVMNGQPAMISIGENVTYVDKVTATTSANSDLVTYSVTTSSVMSGLGLAVEATILSANEIVLHMTPVTSQLQQPMDHETFGAGASQASVGLPTVKIREMATTVRVKDGEMLVVGGLIDTTEEDDANKVPGLGDIPLIKKLFSSETKTKVRKELIILLRPQIIS